MIVHSTGNFVGMTCSVQVEGIERGTTESEIRLFARGAAGAHNKGYVVTGSKLTRWLDENGRPLDDGDDSTNATGARVLCDIEEPA